MTTIDAATVAGNPAEIRTKPAKQKSSGRKKRRKARRCRPGRPRQWRRARFGAVDESVTGCAGVLAISELEDILGVVDALDAGIGPVKKRNRGASAGEVVVAIAQSQLAGGDFLSGLDRHRRDPAAQALSGVRVPAATTAGGLARRLSPEQVQGIETGWAAVIATWWDRLGQAQRDRLTARVTIDIDATDIEVHGSKKERTGFSYAGGRCGRAHPATWAEAGITLAADLLSGTDDPRPSTPGLLRRALAALPEAVKVDRPQRATIRVRQDSGYFSGDIAKAAVKAGVDFAIAAKRVGPLWQHSIAVPPADWTPIRMNGQDAQITVLADYAPKDWPLGTYTIARRVWTPAEAISDSPRARRKRTFGPAQYAADLGATTDGKWAYSFIVTNIPTGGDGFDSVVEVEAWFRGRADIENVIRDGKHGGGLNHLPSGCHQVNTIWTWSALIAVSLTAMMQALVGDLHSPRARTLTIARTIINVPARIIRHARGLIIRPGPTATKLPGMVAKLHALRE